jgi:hypothetical protein
MQAIWEIRLEIVMKTDKFEGDCHEFLEECQANIQLPAPHFGDYLASFCTRLCDPCLELSKCRRQRRNITLFLPSPTKKTSMSVRSGDLKGLLHIQDCRKDINLGTVPFMFKWLRRGVPLLQNRKLWRDSSQQMKCLLITGEYLRYWRT